MAEVLGLGRDALRHLLHIAGDVGEFDAEAADLVGELVDQPLACGGAGRDGIGFCCLGGHSL